MEHFVAGRELNAALLEQAGRVRVLPLAEIDFSAFGQIGVGFVAAFLVAFVTVRAVLAVIGRIGFTPFGWYRIGLGLVMMAVLALR